MFHFFQEVWDDTICPHMLRVFHDHTEKCRSIAISLTISILNYLGEVSSFKFIFILNFRVSIS